jgi:hypothetical protein
MWCPQPTSLHASSTEETLSGMARKEPFLVVVQMKEVVSPESFGNDKLSIW